MALSPFPQHPRALLIVRLEHSSFPATFVHQTSWPYSFEFPACWHVSPEVTRTDCYSAGSCLDSGILQASPTSSLSSGWYLTNVK